MSNLDYIKIKVAFFEKLFFFSLAIATGIIAWLIDKFATIKSAFLFLTMLVLVLLIWIAGWSLQKFHKLLKEISDDAE